MAKKIGPKERYRCHVELQAIKASNTGLEEKVRAGCKAMGIDFDRFNILQSELGEEMAWFMDYLDINEFPPGQKA